MFEVTTISLFSVNFFLVLGIRLQTGRCCLCIWNKSLLHLSCFCSWELQLTKRLPCQWSVCANPLYIYWKLLTGGGTFEYCKSIGPTTKKEGTNFENSLGGTKRGGTQFLNLGKNLGKNYGFLNCLTLSYKNYFQCKMTVFTFFKVNKMPYVGGNLLLFG